MKIKDEKRKSLRHYLKITPKVFFQEEDNKEIGNLSNLNIYGFLLISDKELKGGEVYQIKIILPQKDKESKGNKEISLESNVMCRWIKEKPNKKNWLAGFEFITPTIKHREEIEKIINEYSFNPN